MSRPIKFRAWDTSAHEMTDGFWLAADGSGISYLDKEDLSANPEYKHTDLIVMQFTGLQDKNGTDIYEGDIVKRDGASRFRNTYVIKWESTLTRTGFNINRGNVLTGHLKTVEVVGNIHEHPHLLEEPKE